MEGGYYTLPLKLEEVIQKKDLPKCSLMQSVAQNIHLILTTRFGENRIDRTYGCSIWEEEFDVLQNLNSWKERLAASIKNSLLNHETRITGFKVSVAITQEEMGDTVISAFRVKRKVEINIQGNLAKTNESCSFYDSFYIGPISFD